MFTKGDTVIHKDSCRHLILLSNPRRIAGGEVVTVTWETDNQKVLLPDGSVHPAHKRGFEWEEPVYNLLPLRTYYKGVNVTRGKLMLVVNLPLGDIPFSVWRDVGRLAGSSISTPTTEVFEFLGYDEDTPKRVAQAERILQGALFCHQ